MTVTVTIKNNQAYIDHNSPELIVRETFDWDGEVETVTFYPFELNFSNANFISLFNDLLRLEVDYWGEVSPSLVLASFNKAKPTSILKQTTVSYGKRGAKFIDGGRDIDYVSKRIFELKSLCHEAQRRHELIVWS